MIQLKNRGEILLPFMTVPVGLDPTDVDETTALIKQPTADKHLAAITAPFNGDVIGFVGIIAVAGAAGNSTDLKEDYWIDNDGIDGNQTPVQLTEKISSMDLTQTPDYIPAAGTKLVSVKVPGVAAFKIGDQLVLRFDTSGTLGTATRPKLTPVGLVVRAKANIDPMNVANVR